VCNQHGKSNKKSDHQLCPVRRQAMKLVMKEEPKRQAPRVQALSSDAFVFVGATTSLTAAPASLLRRGYCHDLESLQPRSRPSLHIQLAHLHPLEYAPRTGNWRSMPIGNKIITPTGVQCKHARDYLRERLVFSPERGLERFTVCLRQNCRILQRQRGSVLPATTM